MRTTMDPTYRAGNPAMRQSERNANVYSEQLPEPRSNTTGAGSQPPVITKLMRSPTA